MSLATNVVTTRGPLTIGQRPSTTHPGSFDSQLDTFKPLDRYPITMMLDKVPNGGTVSAREHQWAVQPFNSLIGGIADVYTDSGLTTPTSGTPASGTTHYLKPDSDSAYKLLNVRVGDQLDIRSTSVYARLKTVVTGVQYDGALKAIEVQTLAADTRGVLAGTSQTWRIVNRGEKEKSELPASISEHEIWLGNYCQRIYESFECTWDEFTEYSRLNEDVKMRRQTEAFMRFQQRREFAVLEGTKMIGAGNAYMAGGLRYFLSTYESGNIIDWRTDTRFSSSTDTVDSGTLPFLRKLTTYLRNWCNPSDQLAIVLSAASMEVLNRCVSLSGEYRIDENTSTYGFSISTLKGLNGMTIELWEDPLFNGSDVDENTLYLVRPKYIERRLPPDGGVQMVPWSPFPTNIGSTNGQNFTTVSKGGWVTRETYKFDKLPAMAIVDNFGIEKP